MDFFERMAIVHRLHTFWNPISDEGVEDLIDAIPLKRGDRVLDIACGVGELLVRLAERYGVGGVGVDISEEALASARAKAMERTPDAQLEFVQSDGAAWKPADGELFDAVCLVGASWIWKGYGDTLRALKAWLKPGGLMLFGEPYWMQEPPTEYIEADGGFTAESFTTLGGLRQFFADEGMRLVYMVGSTRRDWDRYEMLQSRAADLWARENPDHPDLAEVFDATDRDRMLFLRWGRDTLGFAQFVLRRL